MSESTEPSPAEARFEGEPPVRSEAPRATVPARSEAPRRRATPEILVGIAAILLSCGALVVSVFQTRILREQQGATVWPRLSVGQDHVDDTFLYRLNNDGVGPAIVREVHFSVHGRSYDQVSALMYREVLEAMADTSFAAGKFSTTISPGAVLRPGEQVDLFQTLRSAVLADRLSALVTDSSYHARILYSDVYGTCWLVDNSDVRSAGRCAEAEG